MGGETQPTVLGVSQEDPGGPEAEAVDEAVESVLEDPRDIDLTVQTRRDVGEDGELASSWSDGTSADLLEGEPEGCRTALRGL